MTIELALTLEFFIIARIAALVEQKLQFVTPGIYMISLVANGQKIYQKISINQ
jgi:hypothetical protein